MTARVTVEVRAYGHLSRFMPGGQERLTRDLPAGSTVTDLLAGLDVPDLEVWIVSVNGTRAPVETVLRDGDLVGMFPPLGGGHLRSSCRARSSNS